MISELQHGEVFGLLRPEIDAHTLGVASVAKIIRDCGHSAIIGDADVARAVAKVASIDNISILVSWIRQHKISRLGFSYRLDPNQAQLNFGKVYHQLKDQQMFAEHGGPLKAVYFAGLPAACKIIQSEYEGRIPVFQGDETLVETILKLGIPESRIPKDIATHSKYDDDRIDFAKSLISKGDYRYFEAPSRPNYPEYGTRSDSLQKRIQYQNKTSTLPLTRVHVGPYLPDYEQAKKEFQVWLKQLSEAGFLDIVSVGSSQLSQSDFGKNWGDKPNGGGVPVNSEKDLVDIWDAARPMLVRTYSSTRNVPELVSVYEKTLNMAWHALSFWWFNQIDGRGPNTVMEGLRQHVQALKEIARFGKPFEPNIPHHFSFRGGDDYSYVLSAYLAAIIAKRLGVNQLVLQTMLNTPKYTWGIQDLAKSRALLQLVRELEDSNFVVYHQPRAGLDYFSPDLNKAKIQLAAVSSMMDDIEPARITGPDIIHVVSYCEAVQLATPAFINESIQISLHSINEYRREKKAGHLDDLQNNQELKDRTQDLYNEVKSTVRLLEKHIPNLYSPEGLYEVMKRGVFAVPYLWEGREEFKEAVKWNTNLIQGSVQVVDQSGNAIKPSKRMKMIF